MSSKSDCVNGEMQCRRSERITAKLPVALSQEIHVEGRQGAFLVQAAAPCSLSRC